MDDQDTGNLSPWGDEETLWPCPSAPGGEWVTVDGGRVFLLDGDDPLPDGVREGDEGVFVIRVVDATREMVEAARAAK